MNTSASGSSDRRGDGFSGGSPSWQGTVAGIGAYVFTPIAALGLLLALMHLLGIY